MQIRSKVLTFKHFSRKGWSLFSCLGREVRIGVLGVATLATAAPRLNANNHIEIADHRTDPTDSRTGGKTGDDADARRHNGCGCHKCQ